jgi:hypothetical protein
MLLCMRFVMPNQPAHRSPRSCSTPQTKPATESQRHFPKYHCFVVVTGTSIPGPTPPPIQLSDVLTGGVPKNKVTIFGFSVPVWPGALLASHELVSTAHFPVTGVVFGIVSELL